MYQIKLKYSELLVRKAIFSFWYKTVGPKMIIAWLALTVLFSIQLYYKDYSWITGMLATVLLFTGIIMIMIYFVHYRSALNRFKKMGSSEALFKASDDNFSISSETASVTLPWSSIQKVWCFPEFYLLFYSNAQFNIFPLLTVDKEVQQYMLQNIQKAGGKVIYN